MIKYSIQYLDKKTKIIRVTARYDNPSGKKNVIFSMANWNPGSYKIRNFSSKIVTMSARTNKKILIHDRSLSSWYCDTGGSSLVIDYDVLACDESYRGIVIKSDHSMLEPCALLVSFAGEDKSPVSLTIKPASWQRGYSVATSLPKIRTSVNGFGRYQAKDFYELIDSPILLGRLRTQKFIVAGKEHYLHCNQSIASVIDVPRLKKTITAINELFGITPFENYRFLIAVNDKVSGGLEHRSCCNIQVAKKHLKRKDGILSLFAHEYFHAWLVKHIKNKSTMRPDLQQMTVTNNLWFFEGFTHYYDLLMLARAGVLTKRKFLGALFKRVNLHRSKAAWSQQSLSNASRQCWIRYYNPHSLSGTYDNCYYNGGMLVALLLDGHLRLHGKENLDTLLKKLARRKNPVIAEDGVVPLIDSFFGQRAARLVNEMIHSLKYPVLGSHVSGLGIEIGQKNYKVTDSHALNNWLWNC